MIDPEIHAFLADWARHWSTLPAGAGPAERRAHFEVVAAAMRQPTPDGVVSREHHVERDGCRVRLRSFRVPTDAPQRALLYLHGGAFMIGSPETHWDVTALLAARTGRAVFSVDYAKSPEHPFPAAVNDARAALGWLFDEAGALGVDRDAIAIGGDSAGANLSAAMTLAFRGSGRAIERQLLVYPKCDFDHTLPSYVENADGPIVTTASMPVVDAMYCPDERERTNPLAAPLLADSHAGLPPAYVAVAEHDPLRDSGVAYAEALRVAGVPVVLDRGTGLIHSYLRALPYCAAARASFGRMADWLAAR